MTLEKATHIGRVGGPGGRFFSRRPTYKTRYTAPANKPETAARSMGFMLAYSTMVKMMRAGVKSCSFVRFALRNAMNEMRAISFRVDGLYAGLISCRVAVKAGIVSN